MFARYFVKRPVFASVLSIFIVLLGLVAVRVLPVAQYPDIAPPSVVIAASYPGASAETLASAVADPIEEQLSAIDRLLYFSSSATSNGKLTITATFEVGTDIDKAAALVSSRVQFATPRLPDEVRRNGVTVTKSSSNLLLAVALYSPQGSRDTLFLSNYVTQHVLDDIKRIPGVAEVSVFGARERSMRLWLQPDRMARFGITTGDIAAAVRAQNAQFAAGRLGAEPAPAGQQLAYTVSTRGRLAAPEEFGDIVLRATGPDGVLRLRDIARVELGAQSYDMSSSIAGQPSIAFAVFLQPSANALVVGNAVKEHMAQFKRERFVQDVDYLVPYDTTTFVSASIRSVVTTLFEATLIVVLVVFLFLRTWRATLIPMLAVPVSVLGSCAGLWLLGFSINTLTLFAMVLAIGIVVDDAIVVLENIERLMREKGLAARPAALASMREVSGAVWGIVLVLCAVFVPVAFMGGMTGQLYRQFALTVAIAVVLSGVVAITLTPALCALLLKPRPHGGGALAGAFARFDRGFQALTQCYAWAIQAVLRHRAPALLAFGTIAAAGVLILARLPNSFVPQEDQGFVIVSVQLPDGATLERTTRSTERLREMLQDEDAIRDMFIVNGFDLVGGDSRSSVATVFIAMRPWSERELTAAELVRKVNEKGMLLPDGIALGFELPSIPGLGEAGGFEFYVQARGDAGPRQLARVTQQLVEALQAQPALAGVSTFYRAGVPQLHVDVDTRKALAMGIPVETVYAALQAQLGSLYVNDFNLAGRTHQVMMQAEASHRARPQDLGALHVRSDTSGQMVPLKALIRVEHSAGPEHIERYNGSIAAKVTGSARDGHSSGEAMAAVEAVASRVLPEGYVVAWTGQAHQEKHAGNASVPALVFALAMVYLILAALYGRWGVPLAVVLVAPLALAGAVLLVALRGMANDVYFQIGLLVLLGLAAKNAILIAEFALQGMQRGLSMADAAVQAVRLRFRPIVMTSLAFVFGVVPLAVASGAGAAARQSVGTGVIGGMLAATFVAPVFIPLFLALLARRPLERHGPAD